MEQVRGFLQEVAFFITAVLRPGVRSVRENGGLAVLSVVLAFGLWIFVTDAENPEETQTFPEDIPVRPVNVPADVWVPEEVGTVRVEVRVEKDVFDSLTIDDFEATVDLNGLTVGVYDLTVSVVPRTDRGNLQIVDILNENDQITVTLAQLKSKSVQVDVELGGSPPSGFTLESTAPEVRSAKVSGPQESIDRVVRVVAPIDVEGRTESFESAVRLEARDQSGHLVDLVAVDPALIDVSVEIEQVSFGRALAVSPTVVGAPGQGYNVVDVTVEPTVVTVFGPEDFIDEAAAISTQPVDIQDATEDVVRTVSLDLPPGVTVRGGGTVTVSVEITSAPSQQVFVVPVSVTGLSDDLSISGSLPSVQVFVFGPLADLLDLGPDDITASVDLGGKDAGTHKVSVNASAPDGLEVRSISPAEIELQLVAR